VFGFGIIAYELLSGSFPFEGSAALQRLKGHVYETPTPLARLCPAVDPAIAAVVDLCLAERPADRPDAATVARAMHGAGAAAAE
jgi:serine/threonine-protein kinase